ncbi:MAG: hypothetical protein WCK90_02060 [archaeon]
MQRQNKKGISEIISYVLLIIIAIGISVLVYNYLYLQIPKETASCQDGITLSVASYTCGEGKISLRLYNSGLFKVDGAYIRVGNVGDKTKQLLNPDQGIFFIDSNSDNFTGLFPGNYSTEIYENDILTTGNHILEIEPATYVGNDFALCDKSIITQTITCGTLAPSTPSASPSGNPPVSCTADQISVNGVCETKSCANGGLTTGCAVAGCYGNGTAWGGATGCSCIVSSGTAETPVCPIGSKNSTVPLNGIICATSCSNECHDPNTWWAAGESTCVVDCGSNTEYASGYVHYPNVTCTLN